MLIAIDPGPERSGYVEIGPGGSVVCGRHLENPSIDALLSDCRKASAPRVELLAQEGFASYGTPIGKTTMRSIWWAGVFARSFGRGRSHELTQSEIRSALFADSALRRQDQPKNLYPTILELYGGKEKAVGGRKCSTCNGKGYRGRVLTSDQAERAKGNLHLVETSSGPRWKLKCPDCGPALGLQTLKGPLYDLHKIPHKEGAAHVRSALAVGVAWLLRSGVAREEFAW